MKSGREESEMEIWNTRIWARAYERKSSINLYLEAGFEVLLLKKPFNASRATERIPISYPKINISPFVKQSHVVFTFARENVKANPKNNPKN